MTTDSLFASARSLPASMTEKDASSPGEPAIPLRTMSALTSQTMSFRDVQMRTPVSPGMADAGTEEVMQRLGMPFSTHSLRASSILLLQEAEMTLTLSENCEMPRSAVRPMLPVIPSTDTVLTRPPESC